MFHPVGPQPPSVYWRRRLMLLAAVLALLVLLVLTVKTIASGGNDPASAQGTNPTTAGHRTSTTVAPPPSSPTKRASTSRPARTSSSRNSPVHSSSSTPPPPCARTDLAVAAVVGKSSYQVGDQPLVELSVTNVGAAPCVQDLADRQVELKVYNGESRVWGSHDCKVQPGTAVRTLAPHTPVLVAVTWSGLSSRPGCAGTRQRVGAGSYTLYATLAGKPGKATQFTIG
jgi:hypothetical protein